MFLDIVGVITTSKLSILSTFQGGAVSAPPPMSSRVNEKLNLTDFMQKSLRGDY